MMGRWGLLAVLLMGAGSAGCNEFNTTIGTPTPASTIFSLSPSSINVGNSPFILTVNGYGFVSNSVVQWNLVNLTTTFVSSSQLTALVPATDIAQAATISITVNTPGSAQSNPQQGILVQDESNALPFLVSGGGNPVPTITSLQPATIAAGTAASFPMKVAGTQFVQGAVVNWANPISTPLATTFVSATEVDVTITPALVATAGTARVSVTNPAGGPQNTGGGTSGTLTFTITDPPQNNARSNGGLSAASSIGPLSPAISSDHRYLAFVAPVPDPTSDASTGPTNVYVRDTCAGAAASCVPATTLISVAADGSAADGSSRAPSISADGRYVSFVSTADNLIAGGSGGVGEIFVRDTCTGAPAGCVPATTLVSLAADGSFANGPSDSPYLSANGRYVVFESSATNLVPNAKSSSPAIYMRDLCTGGPAGCQASTVLLSVSGASASSP
ncbi:MAG TPA: hypothetical protein VEH50_03165 [Methylomirabilota bacterium]|jgi:hypothetical protein|nr:hypothetical protein [Methylomirabilota bacterium]